MPITDVEVLKKKARQARQKVLEMCVSAGEGRLASALSCMEILVALFTGGILRYDIKNPGWEKRDRFIMSKSPGVVGLYPVLNDLGFLHSKEMETYCRLDGLGPYGDEIPGVEAVWGSLAHGLGVGSGLALSAKLDARDFTTFVLLGDGECYEGAIWEAAMFAGHHKLDNLITIVDRNKICTIDFTENAISLEPFEPKWRNFGWDTHTIDGHSFEEIFSVLKDCHQRKTGKPLVIIANTIKGKGILMLENNPMGHVIIPTGEQIEKARRELCQ